MGNNSLISYGSFSQDTEYSSLSSSQLRNAVLRGHLSHSRALAEGAALGWPVPVLEAHDS